MFQPAWSPDVNALDFQMNSYLDTRLIDYYDAAPVKKKTPIREYIRTVEKIWGDEATAEMAGRSIKAYRRQLRKVVKDRGGN